MWRVIIQCSAESWRNYANDFNEIAAKYAGSPVASKKMKDDQRRIMEYEVENVSDAEDFMQECMALDGFIATFESL